MFVGHGVISQGTTNIMLVNGPRLFVRHGHLGADVLVAGRADKGEADQEDVCLRV